MFEVLAVQNIHLVHQQFHNTRFAATRFADQSHQFALLNIDMQILDLEFGFRVFNLSSRMFVPRVLKLTFFAVIGKVAVLELDHASVDTLVDVFVLILVVLSLREPDHLRKSPENHVHLIVEE